MQEVANGWPSYINVEATPNSQLVALHVSYVSPHARQEWEWRFQNPASRDPVSAPKPYLPLLTGLDLSNQRPILVVLDGRSRVGRVARFSILFNKRICEEAASRGWSEQVSGTGERIFAMWPKLFPLVVSLIKDDIAIPQADITSIASASGLLEDDGELSSDRVRRTAYALVRSANFGKLVKEAYEHRCAMCRLGLGLVAGAHILPVSAIGSPDKVWNGIALCHNHHAAFDAHKIWISSEHNLILHPDLANSCNGDVESRPFLEHTRDILWVPNSPAQRPRFDMIRQRYEYYSGRYDWVEKL